MNKVDLLNGSLESSLRILYILDKFQELRFNVNEIVLLDYYIIHLHDFEKSSQSIHPPIPNRENELLVRREQVIKGIQFLESRSLIQVNYTKYGIKYSTNKLANFLIKYMESDYAEKLSNNISIINTKNIEEILETVENLIKKDSKLWVNELN